MGFFSRLAGRQERPDAALPFLSRDQADQVRALVRRAFAEQGVEVTMHDDRAVDDSGGVYGLWNVATACHEDERGPAAWPGVVDDHVRRILAEMTGPDPFEGLTREEAAGRTYLRLFDESSVPALDDYPHREFLPGVVELLALDLPESVAIYGREHADRLGGFTTLRAHALRNLEALQVDAPERIECRGGGYFHLLDDESVYTSGKALLLPDLAGSLTGEPPGELGWLLSVPSRHLVGWHCVRDSRVLGTVEGMVSFALAAYDAAGPVSPHVYWSDGTAYHQLTQHDEDGSVSIVVPPPFQAVLEQVARRG